MSGAVLGLTAFGEGFFKVVLRGNSTHVLQCETVTDSVECIVRYSGSPLSLFYVYNTRYNDASKYDAQLCMQAIQLISLKNVPNN